MDKHRHGWVRAVRYGRLTLGQPSGVWNCVQTLFQRITAPSSLLRRIPLTNCHHLPGDDASLKYTKPTVSINYMSFLMPNVSCQLEIFIP